jgi:hypothetical protein
MVEPRSVTTCSKHLADAGALEEEGEGADEEGEGAAHAFAAARACRRSGARLRAVAQRLWEEDKEQEQMKKEKKKVRPTRLQRPALSAAAVPG